MRAFPSSRAARRELHEYLQRDPSSMAKLIYGMNQFLDGYVDHMAFAPSPTLFRHWIEQVRGLTGSLYGRRIYEVMRYWDEEHPEWGAEEREFAATWRSQPKWVVSRTSTSVGPNATLSELPACRARAPEMSCQCREKSTCPDNVHGSTFGETIWHPRVQRWASSAHPRKGTSCVSVKQCWAKAGNIPVANTAPVSGGSTDVLL